MPAQASPVVAAFLRRLICRPSILPGLSSSLYLSKVGHCRKVIYLGISINALIFKQYAVCQVN